MQTASGGPIKYISDMYQKLSDSPIASTVYDGVNLALYAASPFTGGTTLIPAMAMTGLQATGASANIYDKGLNSQNGIDIASAIPGFGLLNKGVKLAMKPTMKMVGKTTKRVKNATKYLPKKESHPYTYRRMERVGNSGSRRVIRPVEHTIELGRYHPTFWQLAKEDKKYWPAAILVYGEDAINHGLNTYQVIKDIDQKKQGGKMNILEFLKNGSGIHIKEKNKGKFTDYCGGKVTDECIQKGKNSSNPAIRKRATFADNARHFKHLNGGIIKAQQGTKTTTGVNNFLSSDFGQAIINGGLNLLQTGIQQNEQTNAQSDASKIRNKLQWNQVVKQLIKQNLNDTNNQYLHWVYDYQSGRQLDRPNLMVAKHMGYQQLSQDLAERKNDFDNLNSLIDYQTRQKTAQNWGNAIEGVLQEGLKSLSSYYLNNKTSTNSSTANSSTASSPTISSPTTNSFWITPSLTKSFYNNSSLTS